MKSNLRGKVCVLALVILLVGSLPYAFAQETTAGLQGTVKDSSGAVVAKATVELTSTALIGGRKVETDAGGYYRFYNLPPGTYTMTVSAAGFSKVRQEGIRLEVGRLPSIDIGLKVGGADQVVEVTAQTPLVDVTTSKTTTVVTQEIMSGIPKGRSFQSLIQFAPGVRNEPLQSNNRARSNGFQIDGASDGDNSYLVEGMDTTEIRNGGTGTNVPLEFLQEVEVKSSGFEAEYGGGAGVVNVVQKRGSNAWHGSVFIKYITDALNANDQCANNPGSTLCGARGNPLQSQTVARTQAREDKPLEYYLQKKDHRRILEPGFEIGGPLLKDRLWAFVSYLPTFDRLGRTVNYLAPNTGGQLGPHAFSQDDDTHNALTRLDYRVFDKLRLWGSWQYGYRRVIGINLPALGDSLLGNSLVLGDGGQKNTAAGTDPRSLRPDTGTLNPLNIFTFGGDWTPNSKTVVTARYGYFFYNNEDRGRPVGIRYFYNTDLLAGDLGTNGLPIDTTGAANTAGFANIPSNLQNVFEGLKRKQFQVDLAYHVGHFLGGTHNFKVGYGFNRLSDNVLRANKTALVPLDWNGVYAPLTSEGVAACATLTVANGSCRGTAGFFRVRDGVDVFGNVGSYNHSIYLQDSFTYKRLTINAGVRFDKEFVPPFSAGANKLSFGFSQKVAPRLGGAYDVLGNGKLKIYASYGKFFDIMKYSLPRGSFGGEYWHDCVYALNGSDLSTIVPTDPVHACGVSGPAPGVPPNVGAVGAFIENLDLRKNLLNTKLPGLDPDIKPMQQHEFIVGSDWAITPTLAFNVRYARKRLDWTIEDIAMIDDLGFYIGNPGTPFADVVRRITPPDVDNPPDFTNPGHPAECPTCPLGPKAIRRYDGLEFRLTKSASSRWFGTVSYTYSRLTGNYSGLTATTITDGGLGGRHNPNNDRSFDAPQMQWDAHGNIVDGHLATDRPHTLKLFGWYRLKWFHQETTFGISQVAFSGTPINTCWNTNGGADGCVFMEGRDAFVKLHVEADPASINCAVPPALPPVGGCGVFVNDGIVRNRRTPAYTQSDLSIIHEIKVSKNNENMRLGFEWNVTNLLNQRSAVQFWPGTISDRFNGVFPPTVCGGGVTPDPFVADAFNSPTCVDFKAFLTGWDPVATTNATPGLLFDNRYGKPVVFQGTRIMRFKIKFTF